MCWCDGPGKRSATAEGERQTDDRRSPLFPDGIDELPFRLQVKLLTVLPVMQEMFEEAEKQFLEVPHRKRFAGESG
ncbi:hypothetical protein [Brevibacillus thermoruber]|uniref:hypothetical protein n=1 Tax=Brevibacillus thermoruber TaxID=33942 RepID=UPI0003F8FF45|nr:hypothetical protein [Brevibacillus thermoruber]